MAAMFENASKEPMYLLRLRWRMPSPGKIRARWYVVPLRSISHRRELRRDQIRWPNRALEGHHMQVLRCLYG